MCKRCQNIYWVKKTCLGVLDRRDRDKGNEIDLKEGEVIEIETTVLQSRAAPSLLYLFTCMWRWEDSVKL